MGPDGGTDGGTDAGRMGEGWGKGTTLSQNASQLVSASEQPKKYVLDLRGGRNSEPSEALSECLWSCFAGFSPYRDPLTCTGDKKFLSGDYSLS